MKRYWEFLVSVYIVELVKISYGRRIFVFCVRGMGFCIRLMNFLRIVLFTDLAPPDEYSYLTGGLFSSRTWFLVGFVLCTLFFISPTFFWGPFDAFVSISFGVGKTFISLDGYLFCAGGAAFSKPLCSVSQEYFIQHLYFFFFTFPKKRGG